METQDERQQAFNIKIAKRRKKARAYEVLIRSEGWKFFCEDVQEIVNRSLEITKKNTDPDNSLKTWATIQNISVMEKLIRLPEGKIDEYNGLIRAEHQDTDSSPFLDQLNALMGSS